MHRNKQISVNKTFGIANILPSISSTADQSDWQLPHKTIISGSILTDQIQPSWMCDASKHALQQCANNNKPN
jgi:hypothetical protein